MKWTTSNYLHVYIFIMSWFSKICVLWCSKFSQPLFQICTFSTHSCILKLHDAKIRFAIQSARHQLYTVYQQTTRVNKHFIFYRLISAIIHLSLSTWIYKMSLVMRRAFDKKKALTLPEIYHSRRSHDCGSLCMKSSCNSDAILIVLKNSITICKFKKQIKYLLWSRKSQAQSCLLTACHSLKSGKKSQYLKTPMSPCIKAVSSFRFIFLIVSSFKNPTNCYISDGFS